jgi:phosphoglycerol transferase MdoB-like AlkP superfamily enzyme
LQPKKLISITLAVKIMTRFTRIIPAHLRFLLAVHVSMLVIFSLGRLGMYWFNKPAYFEHQEHSISVGQAFLIGLRFDIVMASYAMLIPYLMLTYAYFQHIKDPIFFRWVRIVCVGFVLVALILCAADLPYFRFFNQRINAGTLHLKNLAQSGNFLLKEIKYYPVFGAAIGGIWLIGKFVAYLWQHTNRFNEVTSLSYKWTTTSVSSMLLAVGLWGGQFPKVPDMKSATFSNDGFINQLALNPMHTWFDSYIDFDYLSEPYAVAVRRLQQRYKIDLNDPNTIQHPLYRKHRYADKARPMNVVLILMESMSADMMGRFGHPDSLTPGLDRLCSNSLLFDRCYSNGIHTNAGIYSSLYSLPIVLMEHPMMNGFAERHDFDGLPGTLKSLGYETRFYCTHPKTFDNLDVFLERNGFDHISDQLEYPAASVVNSWGVSDEALMGHALHQLDSLSRDSVERPFFATLLTITAHPPYSLPLNTRFKPRSTDPVKITYEYADWAIASFMDSCATRDWYKNTLFVLVGDHGTNIPGKYHTDVPLSYNRVPLIFHAPTLFKKGIVRRDLANQTDIFPTIMGMLNLDYTQNSMGFDLLREKRPYAFFSQDQRLCVVDQNHLYVARKSGGESMYNLHESIPEDIIAKQRPLCNDMRNFACAHLHVAQKMVMENRVAVVKQR